MKTRHLTALIIDQDKEQSQTMAGLTKDLFNQVFVQNNLSEVVQKYIDAKPMVIFINLSLNQRTDNFSIKDKIPQSDTPTIFFGYNEAYDADLVAHAIENGFHDIFFRPYDPDVIATKVNRFFQFGKTQEMGLSYAELRFPLKARADMEVDLTTVDENGLSFRSSHYVSKGAVFTLINPIVKEIFEKESVDLMVTKTWLGDDWREFYFFAEIKNHNEESSASLRRFILTKI